jgi:hypothetical protein
MKRSLRVKRSPALRVAKEVQILCERVTMLFYTNTAYVVNGTDDFFLLFISVH